jgi:hypothetical protein
LFLLPVTPPKNISPGDSKGVRINGLLLGPKTKNFRAFAQRHELELLDPTGYGGVTPDSATSAMCNFSSRQASRLEAFHIATSNGAEFLGEFDKIGMLAPGKAADIVVLQGDPSTNIKDIEKVAIVFKEGLGYDSAKLIESVRGQVGLH